MGTVVGLIEPITIFGDGAALQVQARIDTGAKSNSIDRKTAESIHVFAGNDKTIVKSAMGRCERFVVMLDIEIAGKKVNGRFTIAERSHLKYPVLIGRDILKKGFIIDPQK